MSYFQHHRVVSVTLRNVGSVTSQQDNACFSHSSATHQKVWFVFISNRNSLFSGNNLFLSLTFSLSLYIYIFFAEYIMRNQDHNLPVYDNKAKWDSSSRVLCMAALLSAPGMRGRKAGLICPACAFCSYSHRRAQCLQKDCTWFGLTARGWFLKSNRDEGKNL